MLTIIEANESVCEVIYEGDIAAPCLSYSVV